MAVILAMGIVTFFNFVILKIKFEAGRWGDLALDLATLVALGYLFGGTVSGMLVAMIASFIMSVYLWFKPPKFMSMDEPAKPTKQSKSQDAEWNF